MGKYFRNPYKTAEPSITTWPWWTGAVSGWVIAMCFSNIMDGKSSAWVALGVWLAYDALLLSFELSSRKYRKVQMAMLNEAHYMNNLFDKGIDVGSPNFTIGQIDADYR